MTGGAEDFQDEVDRLRALVRMLEWGSCDGCGGSGYCPLCREMRGDGHREDCPVVLLREAAS